MNNTTLAHELFDAAEAGDLKKFRELFSDNAAVWHNFDEIDQPVDEAIAFLQGFLDGGASLSYRERDYFEIPGGAVVQHNSYMTNADGSVLKTPTMQRLYVVDGKVKRIEEYLDTTKMMAAMAG